MENIQVEEVSTAHLAAVLARMGVHDPRGVNTPADIAAGGTCMRFVTPTGSMAFVLRKDGAMLWVDGAASEAGEGLTAPGLALAEAIALQSGCTHVAFETNRPGLARLATRQGYRISGFILEKAVNP